MRLRVHFSGMQLFVPVTAAGPNSCVHVVMPKSLGHHAPEHHVPVFMVNDSHLKEGSEQEGRGWFIYSLDGRVLALGEGGADTRICPEVVNLRAATQLDVDADVLEKNGKGKAVARVDLWGGRMSRVETGACWYWFSDTPRPYTHIAEWEIYHPASTIALEVKKWDDSDKVTLPTLYPWKDSDIVDVSVFHLPVTGLPLTEEEEHVPPLLSEPPHFGCYFTVLKGFGSEARPRFAAEPGKCTSLPNECPKIDRSGASPYNCMLATINPSTGG
jgi:hypothetical protein